MAEKLHPVDVLAIFIISILAILNYLHVDFSNDPVMLLVVGYYFGARGAPSNTTNVKS